MDYVAPESIADACRALDADDAHCLAGGQSLVAMMNLGLATPGRLVSLRRIADLRGIEPTRDASNPLARPDFLDLDRRLVIDGALPRFVRPGRALDLARLFDLPEHPIA